MKQRFLSLCLLALMLSTPVSSGAVASGGPEQLLFAIASDVPEDAPAAQGEPQEDGRSQGSANQPAMTAAQAQNYTRFMVEACWQAALEGAYAQDVPLSFVDALARWCTANAETKLHNGEYVTVLSLPDFGGAPTAEVLAYEGEAPSTYLPRLAQGIEELIAQLPVAGQVEQVQLVYDGAPQTIDAFIAGIGDGILKAFDPWLDGLLLEKRAHAAMSRFTLEATADRDIWQQVDFTDENQAPIYSKNDPYPTLKRGADGTDVQRAQEALIAQGYLEGEADGKFGGGTLAAIEAFEAAHALSVDGVLSSDDQRVLYGDPADVTLPALLFAGEDGLGEAAAQWWTLYLCGLKNIGWQGDRLTFEVPELSNLSYYWFDQWQVQYSAGAADPNNIPETLKGILLGDFAADSAPTAACTWTLPLDTFLSEPADLGRLALTDGAQALMAGFSSMVDLLADTVDEAGLYASENLQPKPFPPSGTMMRPSSGSTVFRFRNYMEDKYIYVMVYKVESTQDLSTDNLVATGFVYPNKSLKMSMRPGYYHIHYGVGETWYGEEHMFGDGYETSYNCCQESYHFKKNYEFTLSIDNPNSRGDLTYFDDISPDSM